MLRVEISLLIVLFIDGGGIRGLSSILILKDIMRELNKDRAQKLQPCEVFDMIGGTSTGGSVLSPSNH